MSMDPVEARPPHPLLPLLLLLLQWLLVALHDFRSDYRLVRLGQALLAWKGENYPPSRYEHAASVSAVRIWNSSFPKWGERSTQSLPAPEGVGSADRSPAQQFFRKPESIRCIP